MKTVKWKILTTMGWLATSALGLAAVETTSETFVATATVIKGYAGVGDGRVTYFSLPTVGPVWAAGTITWVGANVLSDANASWTAGVIQGAASCYIEFDSGIMADIASMDAGAKTITLHGAVPSGIHTELPYRIRKHRTIDDVFGSGNEAGLKTGTERSGDNVILQDPETQLSHTYYYFPLSNAWCQTGVSAGGARIYPEQGVMVKRKLSNDLVLYVHGAAKEGPSQVPVYPGWNVMGTLKGQRSLKLSEMNLYTGNTNTGVAWGSLRTADNLMVVQADGTTMTYFISPDGLGWRDANFRLANDVLIAPGSAILLQRKAPRPVFVWTIPAE